jgi:NitT/TauT family transport system permease protein
MAVLLVLCAMWEGYKAIGAAVDGTTPCGQRRMPICANDTSMPHLGNILRALFEPPRRGSEEILLATLVKSALFTWREAAAGFIFGSLFGFALGALLGRFLLLERSLMPYIVASQTVPLLAIAPMIVIWGSRLNMPAWWSVAIISAYLTFFPVTINTLRGLRSPNPTAVELMRSYAASEMQMLWKLRLPAALPYVFTALKVSASISIIGAIIGELPSGIPNGLGRVLLTFSYYYISGPEKLYAAIFGAALLGILFSVIVAQIERVVLPEGRRLEG